MHEIAFDALTRFIELLKTQGPSARSQMFHDAFFLPLPFLVIKNSFKWLKVAQAGLCDVICGVKCLCYLYA